LGPAHGDRAGRFRSISWTRSKPKHYDTPIVNLWMNGALPQNEFRNLGWQPAGNWVVSAGEFSSIPVTHRRHPDNEQKNRDAQFAPKNGQKPKPIGWPAYTSSAHRKGQKLSPAVGYFFCRAGRRAAFGTGRAPSRTEGDPAAYFHRYRPTLRRCSLRQYWLWQPPRLRALCQREVAEIVGVAEATVKTRMFYARKKLAELFEAA
jgi:hypothetical protein